MSSGGNSNLKPSRWGARPSAYRFCHAERKAHRATPNNLTQAREASQGTSRPPLRFFARRTPLESKAHHATPYDLTQAREASQGTSRPPLRFFARRTPLESKAHRATPYNLTQAREASQGTSRPPLRFFARRTPLESKRAERFVLRMTGIGLKPWLFST